MGNTIVAKPSEFTPLTANILAETLDELEFPPGVFNLVHGLGHEVGPSILENEHIKGISFRWNSYWTNCCPNCCPNVQKIITGTRWENATLVLKDADLDLAVEGAVRAAFTNSGQVCLCGSRIPIDATIADAFREKFVDKVNQIRVGDPRDESTTMGSVISPQHLEKVESYIDLALQEGGTILTGGTRKLTGFSGPNQKGAFLLPTVISGLSHTSRCARGNFRTCCYSAYF